MEGLREGDATIIKLGGEGSAPKVVSFEEAFGEHSNAHGKKRKSARERRREKRLQRIADKRERKKERRAMREDRVEDKQTRKMTRRQGRLDRKALGDDSSTEPTSEETPKDETSQQDLSASEMPQQDQGEQGDANSSDNGEDPNAGLSWGGEDSTEEDYGDEGDGGDDGEDMGGFDGASNKEANINPRIMDLTKKIEWNKELVCRMRKQKEQQEGNGESTAIIDGKIAGRIERIKELETKLGHYSHATGGEGNAHIQNQIKQARHIAKTQRRMLHVKPKSHGGGETVVKESLNPEMSEQKIVVPASSNATGVTAIDDKNDFDAPDTRIVELQSNATGATKKISAKHVIIGVGVAALLIYGYQKFINPNKA